MLDDSLNVSQEDNAWTDFQSLPADICEMDQPYQFFSYYFTKDILSYITEQTNLFSVQVRPEKPANISEDDIKAFVGICIYMSVIHLPSTRSYWNNTMEIPAVSQTMTCNRFEEIKRFLHFSNNNEQVPFGQDGHDKLFKIRPFLDEVRESLLRIPKEEHLAIDEQIVPTKTRSSMKQYNPKKPHKWGFKVFVLSGVSGFSYDFDFFCGTTKREDHQPDLGASSNVVVKLANTIPRNKKYKLFFDNWFTCIPLLVFLTKEGILPLGTVRMNRLPNCQLPKENEMKKRGRGSVVEKVAKVDGISVSVVAWYDNTLVTTVSTYVGHLPLSEVTRFDRKSKSNIVIPRPKCIEVYNSYMGGVDLLDSMLGYYRIKIRSKKCYTGFCPQYKYRLGDTYGTTTHKVLLDPTVHHAEKIVLSDRRRDDYQAYRPPLRDIDIVNDRHGDTIYKHPMVPGYEGELRKMVYTVKKYLQSLENLGQPIENRDTLPLHTLSGKLDKITLREWEEENTQNELSILNDFYAFLKERLEMNSSGSLLKSKIRNSSETSACEVQTQLLATLWKLEENFTNPPIWSGDDKADEKLFVETVSRDENGFVPREHGKFGQRYTVQATEALSDFEKLQIADQAAQNQITKIGYLQDNKWDPKTLEDKEVSICC
ncbi:hypothetical protein NQ314_003061 [Rhamnusium bicolor]|uniref:PiggyBac transposable element-derived protein domain-containing protein n=1 Tax=Rhamnusium bicolor TaxID=1586634 RepID=A0AAV8ZMX0_9CUCU|nr:hypothetical protein NQ314_003061 [Rhamnusium bicolor]